MNGSPKSPAHRTKVRTDILSPWPSRAMLGLLDRDPRTLSEGDPLPLGWHWLYFKEPLRASQLGTDGHESRGTFMPEVDLPRRMWAGGTLRSLRPALIGEPAELRSEIREVKEKRGKSGRLVFVTVGQTVLQGGHPCVEEEQLIVYREAERRPATASGRAESTVQRESADRSGAAAPPTRGHADTPPAEWTETFLPTTVTLFQFSALTFNGHRIHYDHPYVTQREGYPGLLVHGPLTALVLLDAAQRHGPAPVSSFRYRALAPLYVDQPATLMERQEPASAADAADHPSGGSQPGQRVVEAIGPTGSVAMRGWVTYTGDQP